jgi:acetoin utilization protein AcuC
VTTAPPRIVDATALPVYDLGQDHPFANDRQLALFDLLRRTGLLRPEDVLPTRPATDDELATAHARHYIEVLRATSARPHDLALLPAALRCGLGAGDNPIAKGQHEAAAAVAGATLACVDAVLDGAARAAFNPAGGLHHAMPDRAAGFCLYNDLVLGIRRARARGVERVLYVDFDVHHGDGVELAFAADPSVLTISFHETPLVRYPGTGFADDRGRGAGAGYAVNVPLEPGTDDTSFDDCTARVLEPLARAFRPGLIVSQHGCDAHRDDPLATLACTTASMERAAQRTRALADELCGGRWVATGGGGYLPVRVLPRAWTMVWAALSGRELPAAVDEGWRRHWQGRSSEPLAADWRDPREPRPGAAAAAAANRATVDAVLAGVPWLRSP